MPATVESISLYFLIKNSERSYIIAHVLKQPTGLLIIYFTQRQRALEKGRTMHS